MNEKEHKFVEKTNLSSNEYQYWRKIWQNHALEDAELLKCVAYTILLYILLRFVLWSIVIVAIMAFWLSKQWGDDTHYACLLISFPRYGVHKIKKTIQYGMFLLWFYAQILDITQWKKRKKKSLFKWSTFWFALCTYLELNNLCLT